MAVFVFSFFDPLGDDPFLSEGEDELDEDAPWNENIDLWSLEKKIYRDKADRNVYLTFFAGVSGSPIVSQVLASIARGDLPPVVGT